MLASGAGSAEIDEVLGCGCGVLVAVLGGVLDTVLGGVLDVDVVVVTPSGVAVVVWDANASSLTGATDCLLRGRKRRRPKRPR